MKAPKLGDTVLCRIQGVEMPAIITKVWSQTTVNLIAFSDLSEWKIANQYVIPKTSVLRLGATVSSNPGDVWWYKEDIRGVGAVYVHVEGDE